MTPATNPPINPPIKCPMPGNSQPRSNVITKPTKAPSHKLPTKSPPFFARQIFKPVVRAILFFSSILLFLDFFLYSLPNTFHNSGAFLKAFADCFPSFFSSLFNFFFISRHYFNLFLQVVVSKLKHV